MAGARQRVGHLVAVLIAVAVVAVVVSVVARRPAATTPPVEPSVTWETKAPQTPTPSDIGGPATAMAVGTDVAAAPARVERRPPPSREEFDMAYAGGSRVIVFGGNGHGGRGQLRDTWEYDAATRTWTEHNTTGTRPRARCWQAMAYVGGSRLVLFGGMGGGQFLSDTWEYDAEAHAWTRIDTGAMRPNARAGHAMAWLGGAQAFFFGGWTHKEGYIPNTWVYDARARKWAELFPEGKTPPVRGDFAMAHLAPGKVLLHGGSYEGGKGHRNDTWVFDLERKTWAEIPLTGDAPSPRCDQAMAFAGNGKVLLFGGWQDRRDRIFGDTWLFDGAKGTWTAVAPAPGQRTPPNRYIHAVARAGLGRIVLFGGNTQTQDTWEFDTRTRLWQERRPQ